MRRRSVVKELNKGEYRREPMTGAWRALVEAPDDRVWRGDDTWLKHTDGPQVATDFVKGDIPRGDEKELCRDTLVDRLLKELDIMSRP